MDNILEKFLEQDFYLIPLYSIENGKCTCKNINCRSPGKHPRFPRDWREYASNRKEKIELWIKTVPNLNFAVATGRLSKKTNRFLVVVDIDGNQNQEFLKKLPDTFTVKTKNGFHKYFWSKVQFKNSVSLFATNVDIRGLNGYVVCPPSKHISGEMYEVVKDIPIVELPDSITVINKISLNKNRISPIKKVKLFNSLNKEIIPCGSRNISCFKLFASKRAAGFNKIEDFLNLGIEFRNTVEDPDSFDMQEIEKIAKGVLRYPAYNSSYEKVNEQYIKWLESKNIVLSRHFKDSLIELDKLFFLNCLEKTDNKNEFISINKIIAFRDIFLKSNNMEKHSKYRPELMARKLESLGYKRFRTAKCNLWNVRIKTSNSVCYNGDSKELLQKMTNTSSKLPENTKVEEVVINGKKYEQITTSVDHKYHPSAPKYLGDSRIEHKMALTKYLMTLSKKESDKFFTNKLVKDEKKTKKFISSLVKEDVIGIKDSAYIVKEINNDFTLETINLLSKKPIKLQLPEIDYGVQTGYAEILERDGKVFTTEKKEIKILLPKEEKEDKNNESGSK